MLGLTGPELEREVHTVFLQLGATLVDQGGRDNHDGYFHYGPDDRQVFRFVLETKSTTRRPANLEMVRQLDDWVYQLSGEEWARKHGSKINGLALLTDGLGTSAAQHLKPHRGVLVLNHCCMKPLPRPEPFPGKVVEFAQTRAFCLLTWPDLLDLRHMVTEARVSGQDVLRAVWATFGVLRAGSVTDWSRHHSAP